MQKGVGQLPLLPLLLPDTDHTVYPNAAHLQLCLPSPPAPLTAASTLAYTTPEATTPTTSSSSSSAVDVLEAQLDQAWHVQQLTPHVARGLAAGTLKQVKIVKKQQRV
jgi:hypothetical protein